MELFTLKKNKGVVTFGITAPSGGSKLEADMSEVVAMLTKKFNKILKNAKGLGKVQGTTTKSDGSRNSQTPNYKLIVFHVTNMEVMDTLSVSV